MHRFPAFVPRGEFRYDKVIHWYPGHMANARVKMEKRFKFIDFVVEVRDARAPFTSASYQFTRQIPKDIKRLIVLNKVDLVSEKLAHRAQEIIEDAGFPCVLTSASTNRGTAKVHEWAVKHIRPDYKTIGIWVMVCGVPNAGKSTVINSLKRLAFAAAKYGRPGNQIVKDVRRTESAVGILPGVTKDVGFFQISNKPRIYCIDTPGITLKKTIDPETNLKMAALGRITTGRSSTM
mmetsp:Transcript_30036/g.87154  ORF Transcript_30036/g.87154 Transcript_30036/m.87154 type:complete len:235 (-) Transcript_30036:1533-2237(-)